MDIPCKKTINITGKHNIDTLNKLTSKTTNKAERLNMESLKLSDYTYNDQLNMLSNLSMNYDFPLKSLLERELVRKISGYKYQDIKKNIYDPDLIITLADTVEKLLPTMLLCFYCKTKITLLYKLVREPTQWTLDRIDNSKGHSKDNTVVACLKCNLQRRIIDIDKFNFTKNLKISKSE